MSGKWLRSLGQLRRPKIPRGLANIDSELGQKNKHGGKN